MRNTALNRLRRLKFILIYRSMISMVCETAGNTHAILSCFCLETVQLKRTAFKISCGVKYDKIKIDLV